MSTQKPKQAKQPKKLAVVPPKQEEPTIKLELNQQELDAMLMIFSEALASKNLNVADAVSHLRGKLMQASKA
jgi:hypothetical protein